MTALQRRPEQAAKNAARVNKTLVAGSGLSKLQKTKEIMARIPLNNVSVLKVANLTNCKNQTCPHAMQAKGKR